MENLELAVPHAATSAALKAERLATLKSLRLLRSALSKDSKNRGGGEMDKVREENERLTNENQELKYRVMILVRELEKAENSR